MSDEIKNKIKTHSLMLLNLYGVKEQLIRENPEALVVFATQISQLFDRILEEKAGKIEKEIKKSFNEEIALYGGKLPFVVFGGKADEKEKITIYEQGIKDTLRKAIDLIKK